MQEKIELQAIARFGKRDGASDYEWLAGREFMPPELLDVCQHLADASAGSGTYMSLVADAAGETYLVRAFRQGVDNAYRPVTGLEVALVVSPRPLTLESWLGLAVVSIQKTERERIGGAARFTINVPPPQVDPVDLDPTQLMRARLGLPLAASIRVALALLKLRPWLYRGVCFASGGNQDPQLGWSPELAPYLCVNFAEPPLTEVEQTLLDAGLSRRISQAEWGALSSLPRDRVQQAIRWSLQPSGPAPLTSSEDELLAWLVAFRSSYLEGAALLGTLRRDLGPRSLPAGLVEKVATDISAQAVAFVIALTRGEKPEPGLGVIEELGARGYLADEALAPLSAWAAYARQSSDVARRALLRFTERGVPLQAAQFVLDMNADDRQAVDLYSVGTAAKLAVGYGLLPPRGRLTRALQAVEQPHDLQALGELGRVYGGPVDALASLISGGAIPPPGVLSAEEMKASLEARARATGGPASALQVLSALIDAGRAEEVTRILQTFGESPPAGMSVAAYEVLRAHFGLAPHAPPPADRAELSLLARLRLASPEDVAPREDDEDALVECARVWASTAKLADLIMGTGANIQEGIYIPEGWKLAVRRALCPSRVEGWLQGLECPARRSALYWLAGLHGFDAKVVEALCGAGADFKGPFSADLLPWLSAYALSATRVQRLKGLFNAVSAGVARGDERLAGGVVRALFPQAEEQSHAFAGYALSRLGPFPLTQGVAPDLIVTLSPWLDPLALIDAIFAGSDTAASERPDVSGALLKQLCEKGTPYPAHGYTAEQRRRHLPLAAALSHAPGWEALAPDPSGRLDYARRLLSQLGVNLHESGVALSEEAWGGQDGLNTPAKGET